MTTQFANSSYLNAFLSQGNFTDNKHLAEQMKGVPVSFTVAEVDYETYRAEHNNEKGWIGRKVMAIPLALCSGVLLTLYHLAAGVFLGPLALLTEEEKGKYFKVMMFSVVRDLQETFGHIMTLFHPLRGYPALKDRVFQKNDTLGGVRSPFQCDNVQSQALRPGFTMPTVVFMWNKLNSTKHVMTSLWIRQNSPQLPKPRNLINKLQTMKGKMWLAGKRGKDKLRMGLQRIQQNLYRLPKPRDLINK